MQTSKILKIIEKFGVDNSPTILTSVGAVGVVATAVLTHKGTLRAQMILLQDDWDRRDHAETISGYVGPPSGIVYDRATRREELELAWKSYLPAFLVGSLTVSCIVGANRIGSKRAAALAAAYTISEKAFDEYKEKVREKIGEKQEKVLRDDIARDHVRDNPPTEGNLIMVGSNDVLCCDMYSGRYFNSTIEAIKSAVNEVNYQINHNHYASLTDFYERIGLARTTVSEEVGWTIDRLLEVHFYAVLYEGTPCMAFDFTVLPIRGYHHLNR